MEFKDKHLHIISFNVPYPANYGGVIDVFYKLKTLSELGVKVHLHTFHYGRERSEELEKICEKVIYYPRGKFYKFIYSSVPYIVGSRQSDDLLSNLSEDDSPILFEGLHTCFYLNHPALQGRIKAVRMHNIEWDYYASLGRSERNFFRKFYMYYESKKLKKFEGILQKADLVLSISPKDTGYLDDKFEGVHYLPAFHPNDKVRSKTGRGNYAIYHGNLGVEENNQAALFLTRKIFRDFNYPFTIAGKNPLNTLKKEAEVNKIFQLIPNPYDEKMHDLISNAQVNILPTFQATGVKLKLLNALYNGRFCLVNSFMANETGLEDLCIVANTADEMKEQLYNLVDKDFTNEMIEKRKTVLEEKFSNEVNAKRLMELMSKE
ncbi:MAG: mannosyltransferase [Chitinophagales bacterium]